MNLLLLLLIAIVVGALIPIQSAANVSAAKYLGDISYAVLLSFVVGLILISVYIIIKRPVMSPDVLSVNFPKYILLGGCISAIYTIAITYLSPKLGVGNALFTILFGQIVVSLLVDHFGVMGVLKQEITPSKIAGMLLILTGVYLTKKT